MITGQLKNKIDSIWDTFFAAGITTPLTVVEQITYLLFIKLLDDNQIKKEASANILEQLLKMQYLKMAIGTTLKLKKMCLTKIFVGAYSKILTLVKCII